MPVEVGQIGVTHLEADGGDGQLRLQQQTTGPLNTQLARQFDEAVACNFLEKPRKACLAHANTLGDHRQPDILGEFAQQIVERLMDTCGTAGIQGRCITGTRQDRRLAGRRLDQQAKQGEELEQPRGALYLTDPLDQFGGLPGRVAAEFQTAPCLFQQR